MLQSHVIKVNGTFIGAAMPIVDGSLCRAVHPQIDDSNGWTWRTLGGLRRAAGHLFITGQHLWRDAHGEAHACEVTTRPGDASRVPAHHSLPSASWLSRRTAA